VFANIASSEQVHTDRILALLEAYGLDDPVGDNGGGVFTDPALQELYDELVALGAGLRLRAHRRLPPAQVAVPLGQLLVPVAAIAGGGGSACVGDTVELPGHSVASAEPSRATNEGGR
jgi:hypothetical protein